MCHDHYVRDRSWVDVRSDEDERGDADEDEGLPSFLADEEPDVDVEILTDGGDEG